MFVFKMHVSFKRRFSSFSFSVFFFFFLVLLGCYPPLRKTGFWRTFRNADKCVLNGRRENRFSVVLSSCTRNNIIFRAIKSVSVMAYGIFSKRIERADNGSSVRI